MILTREDYEKAYGILESEWDNEVYPGLVEINKALVDLMKILKPYETTAGLHSIGIDPYYFFDGMDARLREAVKYAQNPLHFFRFVQVRSQWTCVLTFRSSLSGSRENMSDIHKGLLYWRNRVNEMKDGIRMFYGIGAKYLENYVTNLINDRLAPLADTEANEFLSAFGMAKKIEKVKISILLTKVK